MRHPVVYHGIVGGQIPLGAGMAFGDKYFKREAVTLCFMGDGAVRQGSEVGTRDDVSRASSRASTSASVERDSDGLAGPGRVGQHSSALREGAGAKRCSRSSSGDQPSGRRSPKGSPPYGVPAGTSSEGLGAGRREEPGRRKGARHGFVRIGSRNKIAARVASTYGLRFRR